MTYIVNDGGYLQSSGRSSADIFSESALKPEVAAFWIEHNRKYSDIWPNITEAKPAPEDAKEWEGIPNKLEEHFSEAPGEGD